MAKIALITGIGGQDGYYLSQWLRQHDYDVHGLEPAGKSVPADLCSRLHYADVGDACNLGEIIDDIRPDEVYHLAGLSRVADSFQHPIDHARVNGLGTVRMLEAVRRHRDGTGREIRFYQASSSEMFGGEGSAPYTEESTFHPHSPYACRKAFAHFQTINHRQAFGLFACNGILFNHESPRRSEQFVTRKITRAAARIKSGIRERLKLGNVDALRDWGFAGDYVRAMWLMLQQPRADDFVIATGETHSVAEFAAEAFGHVGLDWREYTDIDAALFRPVEVPAVRGDASKARRVLGWEPRVSFSELARMMVEHDLELLGKGGDG